MASAVPTLLAKIACFRPRIICFVGKGIWLHVERSLRLAISADAGACAVLAAHAGETGVVLKQEETGHLIERAPGSVNLRAAKPESELVDFGFTDSAKPGADGDVPLRPFLTVQKDVKELSDTTLSTLSSFTTRYGSISPRNAALPKGKKKAAGSTFAYGLQPYKAMHDVGPNVRTASPDIMN
jgi:hypothetical protein